MSFTNILQSRAHLQDFHSAQNVEHHWGYADRVVPCTNDPGTCEYLDTVYHSHDLSMLYSWILWVVLLSIFLSLALTRLLHSSPKLHAKSPSRLTRPFRALTTALRHHLLPITRLPGLWSHTTRLQVLILAALLAYLLVFTSVGITYRAWRTPVKSDPTQHSLRSGLGGWSDRVGVLAYALTPLAVFLSARESLLSRATGIPAQHFMFLHAWVGRVIFAQSVLHTFGWTLIEANFYKPQPSTYASLMQQQYMVFGCVALLLVTVLFVFSLRRVVAWTGYEVFRKVHYLTALLYFGACWGHWEKLACWMIASLIVVVLDRAVRLLRVVWIHVGTDHDGNLLDIYPFQARVSIFTDDDAVDKKDERIILRLDVSLSESQQKRVKWNPGQHFYVCFPELSIWQSHPFTVVTSGFTAERDALTFILRTHRGETSRLLTWAQSSIASDPARTLSVVLTGPYGPSPLAFTRQQNILAVAAGTGITYTLPLALRAAETVAAPAGAAAVEHIWIVRSSQDIRWLPKNDAATIQQLVDAGRLIFRVVVTREAAHIARNEGVAISVDYASAESEKSVSGGRADLGAAASTPKEQANELFVLSEENITQMDGVHPDLKKLVHNFVSTSADAALPSKVVASGPPNMLQDLRRAVASCNDGAKVWRGQAKWDIELWCDDRMG